MIDNPSSYPDPSTIVKQEEPFVDVHLYTPNEYVGSLMDSASRSAAFWPT